RRRSSLRVVLHFFCFCRNRSLDSSIWRINRGDSQYNRVLRVLPFPKLPAVSSLCLWMPVQIENFYHTFPRDLVEKIALRNGYRFNMSGTASGAALDRLFDVLDSFAHPSTISTRSRTVQKVFVTPAAIAELPLGPNTSN